jgi:hypothetical protein
MADFNLIGWSMIKPGSSYEVLAIQSDGRNAVYALHNQ